MRSTPSPAAVWACPVCKCFLQSYDRDWRCPTCQRVLRTDAGGRCFDATAFFDVASPDHARVDLAYRLYSLAYAPLALLNMLIVWRGSLGRLVGHYAQALAAADGEVLDLTIGDGALTGIALRRCARLAASRAGRPVRLLGLDLSAAMLRQAAVRLAAQPAARFLLADATAMPIADHRFATVCCYGGLHVIVRPERALAEIRRVIRADGSFHASILTRPRSRFGRHLTRRYVGLGFLGTDFTRGEALGLVEQAGFRLTGVTENGTMLLIDAVPR